ncbi:hypothetical protein G7Z17_g6195 [Cylindrodendrum hubeiense]|uniref:Uncharacterized protein n=1 Tax=Cylindrodendrum hubeiense TaxID=595255 RepID=A0A9P5LB24_9HYPO|nr:hypothetical protein G7Z17_g6195 [Cylindrodendrum hubeiense]
MSGQSDKTIGPAQPTGVATNDHPRTELSKLRHAGVNDGREALDTFTTLQEHSQIPPIATLATTRDQTMSGIPESKKQANPDPPRRTESQISNSEGENCVSFEPEKSTPPVQIPIKAEESSSSEMSGDVTVNQGTMPGLEFHETFSMFSKQEIFPGDHSIIPEVPDSQYQSSTGVAKDPDIEIYYITTGADETEVVEKHCVTRDELLTWESKRRDSPAIVFLPRITEIIKDPPFRNALKKRFSIDDFFLTQTAYDSNGFFRSNIHTSGCRFLVKEVSQISDASLLRKIRTTIKKEIFYEALSPTDSTDIESNIIAIAEQSSQSQLSDFFKKQAPFLKGIAATKDFQAEVKSFVTQLHEINQHATDVSSSEYSLDTYFNMHELSRHLIHSKETLAAAETTMEAILRKSQKTGDDEIIGFCLNFAKNLKLRAEAFVSRLENEVSLAYHVNNVKQLQQLDKIIRQGQNDQEDGEDLQKFVGYVSILFLPGTFISRGAQSVPEAGPLERPIVLLEGLGTLVQAAMGIKYKDSTRNPQLRPVDLKEASFDMDINANTRNAVAQDQAGCAPSTTQVPPQDPYQQHENSLERSAFKEWLINFLTTYSDIIGLIRAQNLDKEAEQREIANRSLIIQQVIPVLFNCETIAYRLQLLQDAQFYHAKRAELQTTFAQLQEAMGSPIPHSGLKWEPALEKMGSEDPDVSALYPTPVEQKREGKPRGRREYKQDYRRGRTGYRRGKESAGSKTT